MTYTNNIIIKILRLIFLSVFVLCCAFSAAGQAKLLDPNSTGKYKNEDVYLGNNTAAFPYLKGRISYLCPAPNNDVGTRGNSKFMRSIQRISKSDGEAVITSGEYVRKTCLSISYNKDWVEEAATNKIDSNYPDIVYAFSVGNYTDGYDVYYWVSDDLSPSPTNSDDDIRPLLSGNASKLFQQGTMNGYVSRLINMDLSGWDFKEVNNLSQFISGNNSMTSVTFGTTVDFTKVTNISEMFGSDAIQLNSLNSTDFSELISTFVIDDSKLTNRNAKAKAFSGMIVTTANNIKYEIKSGSFDKKVDGVTTIMIRNLDASLNKMTINFCWDVVFENESVQSYTVECINADDDDVEHIWPTKEDLLTETDCYLIKDNVKLYRNSYTITDDVNFRDHIKRFRLRITYTNGDIGYSDPFDLFCDGELMPIALSSYTLSLSNNTATLSWTTESETNNDYFTVYASSDGIDFYELCKIDGSGTTSISHTYSYSFENTGIKYIQLSQTDFDGLTEYFDIKSVYEKEDRFGTLKYGPLIFRINNNSLEYHYGDNF